MKNKKESFTSRVGLFLLLVTFCLGTIQAQSSKITGYVKDQSGEPLIGVNVMEKGTTNGTVTDLNGFYSIVAKASNAVLNFSYIGYRNQEIPVAGKKLINVTMKDDSETLDEVVVVGYGTMRKKDLTGSVIQVRPDKIANESLECRRHGVIIIEPPVISAYPHTALVIFQDRADGVVS